MVTAARVVVRTAEASVVVEALVVDGATVAGCSQAGTGPDRLRPGPAFAGIGGRVGELAVIRYMNTGPERRCSEKRLRHDHEAAVS